MQTLPNWLYLWQWLDAVLSLAAYAAAAMPLMVVFTLLMGRRGQARFCFWGAGRMARLGFWLAFAGPVCIVGQFLLLVQSLTANGQIIQIPSVWHVAMLPYTTSFILSLLGLTGLGVLSTVMAGAPLPPVQKNPEHDRYTAAQIKVLLWTGGLSTLVFMAAFVCRSWPFAGLPAGMGWDHLSLLVLRQALHDYFTAFAPAGALLLLFVLRKLPQLSEAAGSEENTARATRWCALWATIGYVPQCLDRLGLSIGYLLRSDLPPGMTAQLWSLGFLLPAVVCWAVLLGSASPLQRRWLIPLALLCLLLSVSMPPLLHWGGLR